jgi:2-C-methyl-D-erythritol 4-phosphate cytidylyltransferase
VGEVSTAVVVPAAGRGERLGAGRPKALQVVAGEPLVAHVARTLAAAPSVATIVVAAPPGATEEVRLVLEVVLSGPGRPVVVVVDGGATRQDSVAHGLAALPPDADVVLVHDAARAFVPVDVVERVVAAVRAGAPAVVPVVAVTDTVRAVDADGVALATPDRTGLRAVQTPQGFRRDVLERAYAAATPDDAVVTDDAALVERTGVAVTVVDGAPEAFKVTTPLDLLLAEALVAARGADS